MENSELSNIIKTKREQMGFSNIDMSILCGCSSDAYISMEENIDNLSYKQLKQICKVLNLSISIVPNEFLNGYTSE